MRVTNPIPKGKQKIDAFGEDVNREPATRHGTQRRSRRKLPKKNTEYLWDVRNKRLWRGRKMGTEMLQRRPRRIRKPPSL